VSKSGQSHSAAVRARLNHPVIDSDGHTVEFEPAVLQYLKQVGGSTMVKRYLAGWDNFGWYRMTPEERRQHRPTRADWWVFPAKNTLDRATITLPKLLHERLDETGIDFGVVYPTLGLYAVHLPDDELRRALCRAINIYHAEIFREFSDRLTPVAVIPMHTPKEALEEIDYVVRTLGLKTVMMPSYVRRPIPALARKDAEAARSALWLDTYCLDSDYDYDPVWKRCTELRVAPTFHSPGRGWGSRTSISNYVYNHIGHFASADEAICKAIFMGGVTRRFPTLKFAFLEGGVTWACSLYSDMHGHWEKRNPRAIQNSNPAHLDKKMLRELGERYGGKIVADGRIDEALGSSSIFGWGGVSADDPAKIDDWEPARIETIQDIRDLFIPNFYFGCEADDPMNALAFKPEFHPLNVRFKAVFASDIGHWDVPDITEVTEEAHELVDKRVITEDDFRSFVFSNPVSLWAGMNPDFFKGTVVERAVDAELGLTSSDVRSR
jgi:predicted TIM-barrel fold metal-dependent hydrolase